MSWTKEEMVNLYLETYKKASTDAAFRQELLSDATAAVEKLAGKKLPEGTTLKAIEKDPAYSQTFILPDFVGDNLTEEELDKIAGGLSNASANVNKEALGKYVDAIDFLKLWW